MLNTIDMSLLLLEKNELNDAKSGIEEYLS